ncbi:MAG: SDR family NAD(P)-dependent oxidoreductase [Myxococcales bacterium]|jgi:NADP-dependent 3-hydroxy acid dehydrogenase YdfG|nr:SDR family NAD(P)-dependent oxidoreductase [Myxococcales bacterium]
MSDSRTAIVTGASAGIGAATARALGALGWSVALGARRLPRLEAVAAEVEALGGRAFAHPLDVTDPNSIDVFVAAAEAALGPADTLVSNAGMSGITPLTETPLDRLRTEVEVNLLGPLHLSRRVIPGFRERGRGDLLFVSSETAVRPRPLQVGYSAAKAGLEAAARALAMELEGTGVRSIILRIGPTGDTEFGSDFDRDEIAAALATWKYWGVQRHLHWMESSAVARAIVAVLTLEGACPAEIEVMPGGRFDRPE